MSISEATVSKRRAAFLIALHKIFGENLSLRSEYRTVNGDITMRCNIHKHEFVTTAKRLVNRKQGCPKCGNEKKSVSITVTKRTSSYNGMLEKLNDYPQVECLTTRAEFVSGSSDKVTLKCNECGNVWQQTPKVVRTYKLVYCCRQCALKKSGEMRRVPLAKRLAAIDFVHDGKIIVTAVDSKGLSASFHCTDCNREWTNRLSLVAAGSGCRICSMRYSNDYQRNTRYTVKHNGEYVTLLGFEPQALRWILENTKVKESHINLRPRTFTYKDKSGKVRTYIPDMSIKNKAIVEVKSAATAGLCDSYKKMGDFDTLVRKAKAVEAAGFTFILMLMQGKRRLKMPDGWMNKSRKEVMSFLVEGV